ncbi:unnamed protein product [Parnassius apollo]|uniref:(apollo) hypothetical protein n=1 Tax=Parnassius apollo TaxID=110799 RepID=A0A8S3WPX9_PARAO|nr:unnamed protein product [Parnassius apollo]
MSQQEIDGDGFQIVTSKRRTKNKQTKIPRKEVEFIKPENYIDVEASYQRVLTAVDEIKESDYFSDVRKAG